LTEWEDVAKTSFEKLEPYLRAILRTGRETIAVYKKEKHGKITYLERRWATEEDVYLFRD